MRHTIVNHVPTGSKHVGPSMVFYPLILGSPCPLLNTNIGIKDIDKHIYLRCVYM